MLTFFIGRPEDRYSDRRRDNHCGREVISIYAIVLGKLSWVYVMIFGIFQHILGKLLHSIQQTQQSDFLRRNAMNDRRLFFLLKHLRRFYRLISELFFFG